MLGILNWETMGGHNAVIFQSDSLHSVIDSRRVVVCYSVRGIELGNTELPSREH